MFKLYPEVFPKGYFRFLKTNLRESLDNGTYIYRDGVLLTWKRYKRSNKFALAGDYLIDKVISVGPGNGMAQSVMTEFLRMISSDCWLKVLTSNKRAISFYSRNGFINTDTSTSTLTVMCRIYVPVARPD